MLLSVFQITLFNTVVFKDIRDFNGFENLTVTSITTGLQVNKLIPRRVLLRNIYNNCELKTKNPNKSKKLSSAPFHAPKNECLKCIGRHKNHLFN